MMLRLYSPAKVNLFLRIVKRRPDGYHELASLFQTIDLCDTLSFSFNSSDTLTCTDAAIPTDHNNLVWKAANLFRRKTGHAFGIKIHLEKNIPAQSGLGGGSSNAATTLWALNELRGRPATLAQLIEWSGEIGSDITFFLSNGSAYCTGRGEIMKFLDPLPPKTLYIIKPEEGLSTPSVYKNLCLDKLIPQDPLQTLHSFQTGAPHYYNDLEQPAFTMMPSLAILKQRLLEAGFETVLMSGSGSSFFCLGKGVLPPLPGFFVTKASFINRSDHDWYSKGS